MRITFTKMQGCGNDYIYINCLSSGITPQSHLASKLTDRHFGIGGDGVVFIVHSDIADAGMRMFNRDGSEGKMCGNAVRCVAKYLYDRHIVHKTVITLETLSGVRELKVSLENGEVESVCVNMGPAELHPKRIPVNLCGERVIARQASIGGLDYAITCVSLGNPHCVVFTDQTDRIPLTKIGPLFENNLLFPDRINAAFAEPLDRRRIKARIWERGSGETLACGTGACAVAIAAVLNGLCDMNTDICVYLPGGELTVRYTEKTVYLIGKCSIVFDGTITCDL
jgi:carbamoyl-phosphate synthase large subunit